MTPTKLRLTSPAKINLFLHINGRRADGYHELQTLFQLLDHGDTLTFTAEARDQILLSPPLAGVADHDNLIIKAARALRDEARRLGHPTTGITIELIKRLPMGGGLGGGSSNAATTLLALDTLWGLKLSRDHLAAIGRRLGADVPVFIHGRTAWAEGIGEILTPIPWSSDCGRDVLPPWYLVVKPDCEVSTAAVFSDPRLTRDTPKRRIAAAVEGIDSSFRNDCQELVRCLHEEVDQAMRWLESSSPARLTGTGSCIFTMLPTRSAGEAILAQLPERWQGFVAKGLLESPLLGELAEAQGSTKF